MKLLKKIRFLPSIFDSYPAVGESSHYTSTIPTFFLFGNYTMIPDPDISIS